MNGARKDPVDVVIVGAGAAGSLLAAKLATAGKSVVIVEAGPSWELSDLTSSQIWSRRLRWGGPHVAAEGANSIGFGFNAGWGVGGAALHHYATWPRLKPDDFRTHSLFGQGLDWPISYAELRPFYDRIQREVGISGDAKAEIWRPEGEPYPMPPLKRSPQSDVIARGFAALGKRVAPAPMAINSVEYNGRSACIYDGWCDAGCPIGALANPHVTYLPIAAEHGAVTVAEASVTRLIATKEGSIEAVEYRQKNGLRVIQPASLVILAASTIGNPGILLNSASDLHPQGIGNASGLVGRYLMTHALISVVGLFPDETQPHWGVTGAHLISHDDYGKEATSGAFGSRQWLIGPSIKPNDLAGLANADPTLRGAKLEAFMRRAVQHAGNMIGMSEEMPDPENRVLLSDETTPWGTRGLKTVHNFSKDAVALWEAQKKDGVRLFEAAGGSDITTSGMNAAHLMGGTIMGDDPTTSVTDSYGRVHGQANLFVAGPGLFPTSGAVNPTFTVHALALRTADHLLANWPT